MSVIYFYNWWSGFFDNSDANNINFFIQLFSNTVLKRFQISTNPTNSNIIFINDVPNLSNINMNSYMYNYWC